MTQHRQRRPPFQAPREKSFLGFLLLAALCALLIVLGFLVGRA